MIIATDKTQLTQFSGGQQAYPVYLTLGNIPRAIRRKPSKKACMLIAYLPVDKCDVPNLSKDEQAARAHRVFHTAMQLILDPLVDAGLNGMEVVGGDGHVRKVHPILACYIADYPEQCLVTCCKYGTCPKCLQKWNALGERTLGEPRTRKRTMDTIRRAKALSRSSRQFRLECKRHLISGSVTTPFWIKLPFTCIHGCITVDVLHQLYQGIIKYLLTWCSSLMSESELDRRLQALPQCFGVRHFKRGWSKLTQVSGSERKHMARILLGCLVGKVPNGVLTCYRALLDFLYLAQYPSHDADSLQYMEHALTLFHDHKRVLVVLGVRNHFDIPKFHSLLHYIDCIKMYGTTDNYNTEAFERLHIDLAKEGWRASNTRNAIPQMTKWLERQEKIEMFGRYVNRTLEDEDEQDRLPGTVGIVLAKRPAVHAQPVAAIEQLHSAPYFSRDLKTFLNALLPRGQAISRAQLQYADLGLGLDRLDVWHSFKLQMDMLGNDVDGEEGKETIKAKPGDKGRFDTIIVAHSAAAEATGLQGRSYNLCFKYLLILITICRDESGTPPNNIYAAYKNIYLRSTSLLAKGEIGVY